MIDKLAIFTLEDLEKEIERRKHLKPKMIENPDLAMLKKMLEDYLDGLIDGTICYDDCDFDHYFYEEACKAFYGDKFFDWFNKIIG